MPINEENLLSCIEIELSTPAKKCVIWLHGLGADGSDFVPIVSELHLPQSIGMRFIFPHAPVMPVTINNGFEMRAWFDIYAFSIDSKVDKSGIAKSVKQIERLIEKQVESGIATKDIFIAGFSQGAAIALVAGLSYPERLAGIIALSGYLPLAEEFLKNASPANKNLPIFIAHGTEDPILPYALGKATNAALNEAGYPVTWRSYAIPHTVCGPEIQDISVWLQNILCAG